MLTLNVLAQNSSNPPFSYFSLCNLVMPKIVRSGDKIYAFTEDNSDTGHIQCNVSEDFGVTWTHVDSANEISDYHGISNKLRSYGVFIHGASKKVCVVYVNTSNVVKFAFLVPGPDEWERTSDITTAEFPDVANFDSVVNVGMFACTRLDGSMVLAYQTKESSSLSRVQVSKYIAGSWTSIALLDTGNTSWSTSLIGAVQDVHGNIHLFLSRIDQDTTGFQSIYHVSISTANAVSSFHLVEGTIETESAFAQEGLGGVAAIHPDTQEIAFAYGYRCETNYPTAGPAHVARGDTSSSFLSPTWTVETVNASRGNFPFFGHYSIQANFTRDGATEVLDVWWIGADGTTQPAKNSSDLGTNPTLLWRARNSGSGFGTQELQYGGEGTGTFNVDGFNILPFGRFRPGVYVYTYQPGGTDDQVGYTGAVLTDGGGGGGSGALYIGRR